jgi:hypothetical protein
MVPLIVDAVGQLQRHDCPIKQSATQQHHHQASQIIQQPRPDISGSNIEEVRALLHRALKLLGGGLREK